jgi:hypothetical protein
MTQVGTPMAARTDTVSPSFVEWSAVLAGAVLAAALSFVFLTFGAAIGLSATSPWPNSGVSVKVVASLAIFWALAQQIGSLMAGGYVAGRMRTRWHETGHEAEFRDGLHGGLVWAVGVLISALLVFATAGLAARTAADLVGKAASSSDAMDVVIDAMLRPTAAQAGPPPAPAGAAAPPRRAASNTPVGDETRAEISRILAASVTKGSLSTENRTYLAQLVAQRTGLSQQEAERRVDAAVTAAREAADKARRAAALTGFVTAAGLILSFGAAWWAALKGGQHRDTSIPARFDFGPRKPVRPTT